MRKASCRIAWSKSSEIIEKNKLLGCFSASGVRIVLPGEGARPCAGRIWGVPRRCGAAAFGARSASDRKAHAGTITPAPVRRLPRVCPVPTDGQNLQPERAAGRHLVRAFVVENTIPLSRGRFFHVRAVFPDFSVRFLFRRRYFRWSTRKARAKCVTLVDRKSEGRNRGRHAGKPPAVKRRINGEIGS